MVGTAADVDNVLKVGIDNRCVLDFNVRIREETEDTVIFLLYVLVIPAAKTR